ncbi:MAG: hypothetical protein K0S78_3360 [Thermomicrobiales bacterium]|jgi:excisionase family DNA binding protein|nr:hypothetical protein [Thermomicrobiales bacterium]
MTTGWTAPDAEIVSLKEAAVRLGISPDAVRKRLERGTLRGEKRGGRWRVALEPDAQADTDQDGTPDAVRTPVDAGADSLIARLESEVAFLRSELTDRTEEIRRRDHIIAGLVEQLRALPAGESARDAPQDANTDPLRGVGTPEASQTRQSAWRRWWRRMTGGAVDLS